MLGVVGRLGRQIRKIDPEKDLKLKKNITQKQKNGRDDAVMKWLTQLSKAIQLIHFQGWTASESQMADEGSLISH